MKWLRILVLASLTLPAWADSGDEFATGKALLARVIANRPAHDLVLQARLFESRDQPVPLEVRIKNFPAETRTIYRLAHTELLVIQPQAGAPRFFLRGTGELHGAARLANLGESLVAYYDLGLGYLHWPVVSKVTEQQYRGRRCDVVETATDGEPFKRARIVIDKEYAALLRAELVDQNDNVARRLAVTSFRKVDTVWIPRGIEVAFVPGGQSLPAQEKSRIEIYDGNFSAQLPAEEFDETKF